MTFTEIITNNELSELIELKFYLISQSIGEDPFAGPNLIGVDEDNLPF